MIIENKNKTIWGMFDFREISIKYLNLFILMYDKAYTLKTYIHTKGFCLFLCHIH